MEKDLTDKAKQRDSIWKTSPPIYPRTGTKLPKNRVRFHHRKNRMHPRRMV